MQTQPGELPGVPQVDYCKWCQEAGEVFAHRFEALIDRLNEAWRAPGTFAILPCGGDVFTISCTVEEDTSGPEDLPNAIKFEIDGGKGGLAFAGPDTIDGPWHVYLGDMFCDRVMIDRWDLTGDEVVDIVRTESAKRAWP